MHSKGIQVACSILYMILMLWSDSATGSSPPVVAATNFTITDIQVKTTQSKDMAMEQVRDADLASKTFEGSALVNSTSGKKILSRNKTTPTSPNGGTKDIAAVVNSNSTKTIATVDEKIKLNSTTTTTPTPHPNKESNSQTVPPPAITTSASKSNKTIIPAVTTSTVKPSTKIVATTKLTTTPTTKKSTTTTKTTQKTTPEPRKPIATYGIDDFPEMDSLPAHASVIQPSPETAPIRELPNVQPSQELNTPSFSTYNKSRDYIVLFLSILFAVPLAIGVVITAYRRFRDFWSTRHYRRMDFLVDGMYND